MIIKVNGKEKDYPDNHSISDVLKDHDLAADSVIIEYNQELIIDQSRHDIVLKQDDKLEFIRFVGGG